MIAMNRRKLGLLAWCAALGTSSALAQTAAPDPAPASTNKQDVVELTPFEVRSETNRGYIASETMTGSRVATQIKDLPYSVNVLTSEMFEDFAFFELNDNVAYIGSFTGLDQGGGFNLRGFNATNQLRDGFFRLGRYGSSNVDRIEVIKGPNAAIYGQTSPGGMLNMISKKPKKKEGYKLSVSAGDYDTNRETFEANGTIGFLGNTAYIATLGFYERGYETPMTRLRNKESYVAVEHTFADDSTLLVQAETFNRRTNSPQSVAPYILNDQNTTATTDDKIVGLAKGLANIQQFGPISELVRGNTSFTGTYSKKLSSIFSSRVSGNYYRARRWEFNQNTAATQVNQRTLVMQRGATPNRGFIFEDGGGAQADLLAQYFLANRRIEVKTLLTFDYNTYYRYDPTWGINGTDLAGWTPLRSFSVTPELDGVAAPLSYLSTPFDFNRSTQSRKNKNRTINVGLLLRHQMSFIDGRLLTFAGARFDKVNYDLHDFVANATNEFETDAFKPNFGASWALDRAKNFRVYGNYSESFFPNQQFITAALINPLYKSETADGIDYGIKGTLLDGKINFTLGGFRINRQNVITQELNLTTGLLESRPEGAQLVQGAEVDVTYNASANLSFTLSYGYVDSQITDFGTQTQSVGRSAARVSPQNGGFTAKYTFRNGALKGLSANLGIVYQDETPTEAPNAGDTYSTTAGTAGTFLRSTDQWMVKVPAFTTVNIGVRYALQNTGRFKHGIGVNVNNLFDENYLNPNRLQADRRSIFGNYTLQF
ncbi:TonB-dependent siderophore receptor [Oleiharenicola lentus]|uniref:TonB-dependent siderophore receptor n=1 Tax=Oleiharenicola lentus TaxID=2508720 RepID=UPI003F673C14